MKKLKISIFKDSKKDPLNKSILLISFASGLLWALSMPGFNLNLFAWIGFIPLVLIVSNSNALKNSLIYSFFFGLGFSLMTLNWLLGLHSLQWLGFSNLSSFVLTRLIWLYLSTYKSYYFMIFGLTLFFILKLKYGNIIKSLLIAFSWSVIINKLMSLGKFGFPWAMIEYSQYNNLPILQFAQYIGGIGIGFIIILTNTLIAFILLKLIKKQIELKPAYVRITAIVTSILVVHMIGLILLNFQSKPDKEVYVTVIQGNISVEEEKQNPASLLTAKNYYSDAIKKAPAGLIVLPETAFYDFIRYNNPKLYDNFVQIAQKQDKTLIVGAIDGIYNSDGYLTPTNSALIFDKHLPASLNNIYHKQLLVPFGEYTPFFGLLPESLKKLTSTASRSDLTSGNTTMVIPTSLGNIAPSICYEIIFPRITKLQVQNDADILVDLSNLSWFRDTIIKDQFIAFSVIRAAESRRPLVLSVNTGRSAIISFTGKILKELDKNKNGTISTKVGYINEKSLFSKSIF